MELSLTSDFINPTVYDSLHKETFITNAATTHGATTANAASGVFQNNTFDARRTVAFCRVRYVRRSMTSGGTLRTSVGKWSPISTKWLSTNENACTDSENYLNTDTIDVKKWTCALCPVGGSCRGSLVWSDVRARDGYWRDNGAQIPRKYTFIRCEETGVCMGVPMSGGHGNYTESCNSDLGRLQYCNNTHTIGSTCRLCGTCKKGYSKTSDGSCSKCEVDTSAAIATSIALCLLLVSIAVGMVFLKIKAGTSGHGAKVKAIHSTIKRIMLSHMQVIALCLSLNVPWPHIINTMMRWFATVSSVSEQVNVMGCQFDTENPVRKDSRMLYFSTMLLMMMPIGIVFLTWTYWFILVPTCGCLACGRKNRLVLSQPCQSRERRRESRKLTLRKRSSEREQRASIELSIRSSTTNTSNEQKTRDSTVPKTAASLSSDNQHGPPIVETRDIWVYCSVLFLYMVYPTLVRYPFQMLSCRSLHYVPNDHNSSLETWATRTYLTIDMEEVCGEGQHLLWVLFVAFPGIICYTFGLPIAGGVLLYRANKQNHLHINHEQSNKYIFRYGLIYSGYRLWWWELIISLRKVSIIVMASFGFDNVLQLHYTLFIMFTAFALHYMAQPFDTTTKDGQILHGLERNSMLALFFLLWSAVVFTLNRTCNTLECVALSFLVLVSNVLILIFAMRMFVIHFLIRTKLIQHATTGLSKIKRKRLISILTTKKKAGENKSPMRLNQSNSNNGLTGSALFGLDDVKENPMGKVKVKKAQENPVRNHGTKNDEEDTDEDIIIGKKSTKGMSLFGMYGTGTQHASGKKDSANDVRYHIDASTGQQYYIDPVTRKSVWGTIEGNGSLISEAIAEANTWKEVLDPKTGKLYYYNEVSQEVSWTQPKDWGVEKLRPSELRFGR